jgi:hypothetical protein
MPTSTSTPTPTATWALCPGNIPAGEPDIGSPDGTFATIACDTYLNIDLDAYSAPHITSHSGYDFVYFEQAACGGICLDWVRVDVSADNGNWVTIFNWGDGIPDNNTNIASYSAGGEDDNEPIPASALYCDSGHCTGIEIDVDSLGAVPSGGYRYIRIWSPRNPNNDGSEVDALLVFP